MRLQFIDDHRDEFPVSRMCEVLDVSRSRCYAWRGWPPSKREIANRELYKKIEAVYDESNGTYGSARIYREVKRQDVPCSEDRVARLMRLRGLRGRQTKTYEITTKRNKAHPVGPNVLKRDFEAEGPNEKWLADRAIVAVNKDCCTGPPLAARSPHAFTAFATASGASVASPCRAVGVLLAIGPL